MRQRLARLSAQLSPQLPRSLWIYESGALVNAFGRGMTLPFVIIYLHNVRGVDLGVAGLVAATFSAASFVGTIVGGALSDRVGARKVVVAALVVAGSGYAWLGFVHEARDAFLAMVIAGFGNGCFFPGQSSLMATLAGRRHRHGAFAMHRAADNLGLGLGVALAGLIAMTSKPGTFTALFLVDASTSLLFAVLIALAPFRAATDETEATPAVRGTYREVFRQRLIVGIVAVNVLYVVGGYALLDVAVPVFAKNEVAISERGIGLIFVVNTLGVALLSLPVARLLEGRRRLGALAAMTIVWSLSWAIIGLAAIWLRGVPATAVFMVAVFIFAAGEVTFAVQSALVADLAPARIRARALGLITTSNAVGITIGPALAGFLLDAAPRAIWPAGIAVLLVGGAGALLLDRRVPNDVRRTPRRAPPPAPPDRAEVAIGA